MKKVLITIIIPIYNIEKHLKKCLSSVLTQNFSDFELILINDGSTDNSLQIAQEFAENDNRIKLATKLNGGVSSARNLGLQIAVGKWIYFLDADDFLNDTAFKNIEPLLSKNDNCDMVLGNYSCVNSEHELMYTTDNNEFSKKGEDLILDYGLWRHKIVMGAYFVKKSLLIKHNLLFNEKSRYAEDTEFINYCLLNAHKVISVKNVFFNYVVHNESAIARINFGRFDVYKSKQRILDYIEFNFQNLMEPKKMFTGFLLPEAIIDTIELLCKEGISLKKINKYLEKNNYYSILSVENFNEYTTTPYRTKINLFLNKPRLFWFTTYLKSKQYQIRVFASNTLRRLKLYK